MASTPNFTNGARLAAVAVSAANTNRDGTGTIVSVMAGASGGTKINRVTVQFTVTSTAGMIRLYLSSDTGSTWKLFDEIPVSAVTVAASTPAFRAEKAYTDLELPSTAFILGASTHNAEASVCIANGGDFV